MSNVIGERLAEVRKDHKDRQADLAEKLHVTLYTIRSWEQEKSSPSNEMLVRICMLYHVSADYLLGLSNHDPLLYDDLDLSDVGKQDMKNLREYVRFLKWKNES